MRSARQGRYRCLLRLKGEKDHGVKAPLRDPFLDGWTPVRAKRLGRFRPEASRCPCGFLQKNDGVGRRMRMCIKAQGAYSHQPSTEEEPTKAVDPLETSPSMLTRGISYFTPCIAAGPAVCRVPWHPTVDLLYHHGMPKSKPPSRDMGKRTRHSRESQHVKIKYALWLSLTPAPGRSELRPRRTHPGRPYCHQ